MGFGYSERVKALSFLGWVADFCAICRSLRPFLLRTSHLIESEVHFIAVVPMIHETDLGVIGYDRVCDNCGFCTPARPEDYSSVIKIRPDSFDELLNSSQPGAKMRFADRLKLESEVSRGALTPEQRRSFLAETLYSLDPHLGRILPPPIRRWHWLTPLGVLAASVLLGFASEFCRDGRAQSVMSGIAGLGAIAGAIWLVSVGIRAWLRPAFVRRTLLLEAFPLLVRAWSPLRPTRDEVESAVSEARRTGSRLGRELSVDRLMIELGS